MKCVVCKSGEALKGKTTVVFEKGRATIVFKNVPADICDQCGEVYLSDKISEKLLSDSSEIERTGSEMNIKNFDRVDAA